LTFRWCVAHYRFEMRRARKVIYKRLVGACDDSNTMLNTVERMKILHTYHDGSVLGVMSSKRLIRLPIWKGQRIMDTSRVSEMKRAVGTQVRCLDSGYHVVKYNEDTADGRRIESIYLIDGQIDGQHRAAVIRDFYDETMCEPEFDVTVTERTVASEADAIEYFNQINNVKVQQWAIDPNLLVNNYIHALEMAFNKPKVAMIRPGKTKRPYLSSDAIRSALTAHAPLIKGVGGAVARFVSASEAYNVTRLHQLSIELLYSKSSKDTLKESAIKANFALAYDDAMEWVRLVLESTLSVHR